MTNSNLTDVGRNPSRLNLWILTSLTVFLGFVIFVGILGNLLTLVVMRQKSMRRSSVAVFLSALAVFDSLVLIQMLLNRWLFAVAGIEFQGISHTACKLTYLLFHTSFTLSSWLQMFVAGEGFIVVSSPLKAKVICTRRNSIITVVTTVIPVISIYMYCLWGTELDSGDRCNVTLATNVRNFMDRVGPWLLAVFYSFIPTSGLVVVNSALIFKLYEARHRRHAMSTVTRADKSELQINVMVVISCLCCVVLTVPGAIHNIDFFAAEPVGGSE